MENENLGAERQESSLILIYYLEKLHWIVLQNGRVGEELEESAEGWYRFSCVWILMKICHLHEVQSHQFLKLLGTKFFHRLNGHKVVYTIYVAHHLMPSTPVCCCFCASIQSSRHSGQLQVTGSKGEILNCGSCFSQLHKLISRSCHL